MRGSGGFWMAWWVAIVGCGAPALREDAGRAGDLPRWPTGGVPAAPVHGV